MQKISLFYLFILEIQLVLEFRNQTGHTHSWPLPPKHFLTNFSLRKFVSTGKKSRYFTDLEICLIKNSCNLTEKILDYISGTKNFANMVFVQEHIK